MSDTRDPSPSEADPGFAPPIRFLKILVTVLAGTMIAGLITIIVIFVTRFPSTPPAGPALPANISLPAGVTAGAVTFGKGWVAIVTEDGTGIFVFDAATGALRQQMAITP